jgi:Zn-finger nucleic acid-binding protein
VCPTDHGVFVAHDVLASMRAEGPAAVAELDTVVRAPEVEAHYIHCPRCHEPMARRAFARGSGIVVDVCAAHGTWFDAGEIHDALAFQVKSGQPAPSDLVNIPAQAKATLDVALAFEAERDASEVKEMTRDLTRTFTHVILGGRTPF